MTFSKSIYSRICKIALIVFAIIGSGFQMQYAIDTYYLFKTGISSEARNMFFKNCRPVIALIYKAFSLFPIPEKYFYYFSFATAFIFLVASIFLFEHILADYIDNENTRILLSLISIANIFIIEYFMFIEKGGFLIGIFCNVLTVFFIKKYIDSHSFLNIIFAIFSQLVAILSYQGTMALFFILALPILFKEAKKIKEYVLNFILLIVIYWVATGIDLIIFTLFCNDMRKGSIDLMAKISEAIYVIKDAHIRTYDLLPNYLYFVIFLFAIIINIISISYYKCSIVNYLNLVVLLITVLVLPCAPIIGSIGWGAPRIIYPIASGAGILLVNFYINILPSGNIKTNKNIFIMSTYIIIGVLVASEYYVFVSINNQKYKANYADQIRICEIGQAIQEYELSTGIKIKQIAFYTDASHDYNYFPGLNSESDLVISSFHSWDSQLNAINYYLGTDYIRSLGNEWFEDYYSSFDWHCYSPMQIEFDNDTLHYCVY